MCFYPGMGGGGGGGLSGFLIPPSVSGQKLNRFFRPLVICHFFLAILELVCGRYVDGAFDLIAALIGMYVIRNPDGYGMQSLCCYVIMSGVLFVWDLLRDILYFSGASSGLAPSPDWQYYLFLFVTMALPFCLVSVICLGWFIRKDLQASIAEMQEQMAAMLGQAPGGGGQQQQQQQQQQDGGIQGLAPGSVARQEAPSGFRAFAGSGNRLGGT